MAGGIEAIFKAKEGAEDSPEGGAAAMDEKQVNAQDVVMGIATGGTTPFVHGALRRARQLGAGTIFLSCVQPLPDEPIVDVVIRPITGPEVLTGSTRLKAGTATKLVLNTLTTTAMIQMGKVYGNLMVDLKAVNRKLRDRSMRIVMEVTGLSRPRAKALLARAQGRVKPALVMHLRRVDLRQAVALLDECNQSLHEAIKD
jgi:N-acetylmuramic acid 6-phosphate etherase